MHKQFKRASVVAAGLFTAVGLASPAQATTKFSIDTTVSGGSAWTIDPPGYLVGRLNVANPSYSANVNIGMIELKGQLLDGTPNTLTALQVFCIDFISNLAKGTFNEVLVSSIESDNGGTAHVQYTQAQVDDLFKFMVYASTQGITNPLTSAAAQLGIWEILGEDGANPAWDLNSGNLSVAMANGRTDAVTLAHSWLAASTSQSTSGYSLHVLDPGAGNQIQAFVTYDAPQPPLSAVPEPASWITMIAGFGVIGGLLRRRRRATAFA